MYRKKFTKEILIMIHYEYCNTLSFRSMQCQCDPFIGFVSNLAFTAEETSIQDLINRGICLFCGFSSLNYYVLLCMYIYRVECLLMTFGHFLNVLEIVAQFLSAELSSNLLSVLSVEKNNL